MLPPPQPVPFTLGFEFRIGCKTFRPAEKRWWCIPQWLEFVRVGFIKAGEIFQHDTHTGGIDGQHVGIQMQPGATCGQQAERYCRRWGNAQIDLAMAPRLTFGGKTVRKRLLIERRHVLHVEAERPAGGVHRLSPFRIDPEAEHGVTPAKPFDRDGQSFRLQPPAFELEIEMRRNFSEYPVRLSADPVGNLHGG